MRKITVLLALSLFLVSACVNTQNTSTTTTTIKTDTTTTTVAEPKEGLDVGDIAPGFELVSTDGKAYKLSDFRGQVVLLNFWATWCPYCKDEMPIMQDMHEEYGDKGLLILAVDIGETKAEVESFMRELGLTFPALLDRDSQVYRLYNKSNGIPQTYIIDRNGIIQGYTLGSFASLGQVAYVKGLLVELLGIKND